MRISPRLSLGHGGAGEVTRRLAKASADRPRSRLPRPTERRRRPPTAMLPSVEGDLHLVTEVLVQFEHPCPCECASSAWPCR